MALTKLIFSESQNKPVTIHWSRLESLSHFHKVEISIKLIGPFTLFGDVAHGQYQNTLKWSINDSNIVWPGRKRGQKPDGFKIPTFLKVMTIVEQPFVYARPIEPGQECLDVLEEVLCPWFNNSGSGMWCTFRYSPADLGHVREICLSHVFTDVSFSAPGDRRSVLLLSGLLHRPAQGAGQSQQLHLLTSLVAWRTVRTLCLQERLWWVDKHPSRSSLSVGNQLGPYWSPLLPPYQHSFVVGETFHETIASS